MKHFRKKKFHVSDTVVHKSGGPPLTIEASEGENILCSWRNTDGSKRRLLFPAACVRRPYRDEFQ